MARQRLELNEVVTAQDLAPVLQDNEGTYLCRQGRKSFLVTSRAGHSIASMKPVGQKVQKPWVITKISNSTEISEQAETGQRQQRQ